MAFEGKRPAGPAAPAAVPADLTANDALTNRAPEPDRPTRRNATDCRHELHRARRATVASRRDADVAMSGPPDRRMTVKPAPTDYRPNTCSISRVIGPCTFILSPDTRKQIKPSSLLSMIG